MQQLRFAIIGCGHIAQRHAQHITQRGTLVAVCDILSAKAQALGMQYHAAVYTSIDELLQTNDIDVAVICTPNGLHAQHSIKALQAGCHVLCEKPMALQVKDAENMIQVAAQAGKHLFIVKQNRYNPPVVAVKQALEAGKLGRVYSIQLNGFWNRGAAYYHNSWKGTLELDGGTLYTQFSHFIDLLYWLIGDVKAVKALLANYAHQHIIEFEDTGMVLLEFTNGVTGTMNYTINSHSKNMEGSLTIFAEKGTVKIGGQYLNVLEYQDIEGFTIDGLPAGNPANDYATYQGSMSNHDKVYENLVEVLQHQAQANNSTHEALQTVAIIEKIYREAVRL